MADLSPDDQAFFDLVTRFLDEANRMNGEAHRSRISAALLFAAARYNAFTWLNREINPGQTEDEAVEMFTDHYRKMWRENVAFLRELEKQR
jgi:hypothetical protein